MVKCYRRMRKGDALSEPRAGQTSNRTDTYMILLNTNQSARRRMTINPSEWAESIASMGISLDLRWRKSGGEDDDDDPGVGDVGDSSRERRALR